MPSCGFQSSELRRERRRGTIRKRHREHKALEMQELSVTRVSALEMQMRTTCRVLVSSFALDVIITVSVLHRMYDIKD